VLITNPKLRKIGLDPRLPVAFFEFFLNRHFKISKKKSKKYKDVVNYIHYECAKF
jgi:hypothetical protein